MASIGAWRRVCGRALKWRTADAIPDIFARRRWRTAPSDCGDSCRQQRRQPERTRTWRARVSGSVESGGMAADDATLPRLFHQTRLLSSSSSSSPSSSTRFPLEEEPEADGRPDAGLLHVLRCEVGDLNKRFLNIISRKPPKPYTLVKDEPGAMEMTLNRIYGLEDISICCVMQLVSKQYERKPEVGEDPESRKKMLQLTISITKGGASPVLRMRCECYRDGFVIHQVDLESDEEEHSEYRPYFSSSKRELVNAFQIFLYERGLNADLATYMENHLDKKRLLKSSEYVENVLKFLH